LNASAHTSAGIIPTAGLSRARDNAHTFATEWRNAGGSLAALQAILGHSSVKVTEIYGAISDDLVEREATRVTEVRAGRNRTKNATDS